MTTHLIQQTLQTNSRLLPLLAGFLLSMFIATGTQAQQPTEPPDDLSAEDVEQRIENLEKPMYTPFVELYLLEESKALRKEMQNTRAELIEKVVDAVGC